MQLQNLFKITPTPQVGTLGLSNYLMSLAIIEYLILTILNMSFVILVCSGDKELSVCMFWLGLDNFHPFWCHMGTYNEDFTFIQRQ